RATGVFVPDGSSGTGRDQPPVDGPGRTSLIAGAPRGQRATVMVRGGGSGLGGGSGWSRCACGAGSTGAGAGASAVPCAGGAALLAIGSAGWAPAGPLSWPLTPEPWRSLPTKVTPASTSNSPAVTPIQILRVTFRAPLRLRARLLPSPPLRWRGVFG